MTPDEIDPQLKRVLDELKPVPERSPQAAARGRARFLAEAAAQSVSPKGIWRHTGQIQAFRKERFAMNVLVTTLLAFTLLFGGTAGAAYAAQDDLPGQALYPVKTLAEDIRLGLASDPQGQLEMLGELAQARVQEMAALHAEGVMPPQAVALRLQQHNEQALALAAGLDDAVMLGALDRLQTRLRTQLEAISQACTAGEPDRIMLQTRTMLQTQLHLVESGLADPQGFRYAVRSQFQNQAFGTPGGTEAPGAGNGPGGGPATAEPGTGYGPGGSSGGMSDPGSGQNGYGPGGSQSTEAPGAGSGPGGQPETDPAPNPNGNGGTGGNGQGGQGGSGRP